MASFLSMRQRKVKTNSRHPRSLLLLEALERREVLTGPDAFGYTAVAGVFQNIDLQPGTPGVFAIAQSGDDVATAVDLGSNTFNLYGHTYTGNNQLWVTTNGLITFGTARPFVYSTDLTATPNEATIAVLAADLTNSLTNPSVLGKFEDTNGDGVADRLIIEWHQVKAWADFSSPPITFDAVLQLNTGANTSTMTFDYTSLNSATPGLATVGIKDVGPQGGDRLLVSYRSANPLIGTGQAITFTAPAFGAAVSGQVFNDLNNNGTQDAGESGMANWVVFLDSNNNGTRDAGEPFTTTNSQGDYQFSNLLPGTYSVTEEVQASWNRTLPATSAYSVTLSSRQLVLNQNFGDFKALVAVNDSYTTKEEAALTVTAPGVLNNDNGSGASLTASLVSGTSHGTLALKADGSFTYTPNAEYVGTDSFTYQASDGVNTSQASVAITVTQVADIPNLSVADVSGNQNSPIPLAVNASTADADGSETLALQISGVPAGDTLSAGTNQGNGIWALTAAQLSSLTLTGPNNSSFALTVTATTTANASGDTAVASASFNVTINNVAPSNVQLQLGSGTINENDVATLSGSFSDPGPLDTHTVTVNWGDGSTSISNLGAGVPTFTGFSHQYVDNPANQPTGSYSISVTVTDNYGASGNGGTSLQVNNVAPTNVSLALVANSINENGSASLGGTFADPGTLDTHSVTINWGDGNSQIINLGAGVLSFSGVSHQYLDNPGGQPTGNFAISVTVADEDGASGNGGTSVQVNNVAPANVNLVLSAKSINENDFTSLSGTFTDPGTLDTHSVTINWGDGKSQTVNLGAGVLTFNSVSHQYLDNPNGQPNGTFPISVTVTDKDNASAGASTGDQVMNVAPGNGLIKLSSSTIKPGGSITLDESFTDPGTLDTHSASIDWGDGSNSSLSLAANVLNFAGAAHTYAGGGAARTFTIKVTLTDKDGNSSSSTATVQEVGDSGQLAAQIAGPTLGVRGQPLTYTLQASPATTGQVFTYAIDWNGDGIVDQIVVGPARIALDHLFNHSGSKTISVTATDATGLKSAPATLKVNITAVALEDDPLNHGKTMLVVGGTMGDDVILFRLASNNQVQVYLNWKDAGVYAPTSRYVAYGQAGNDVIDIGQRLKLPAWLYGGDGNDVLIGGGGDGVLLGGGGDDVLVGGAGRNLMIGGMGADRIYSRGTGDIDITGWTTLGGNPTALAAIMREWTSTHDLATRKANIGGTGSGATYEHRLNCNYFTCFVLSFEPTKIQSSTSRYRTELCS